MPIIDPVCGMEVNPDEGFRLEHGGTVHYFCSERCRDVFAREKWLVPGEVASCCAAGPRKRWYRNKTVIVAAVLIVLLLLAPVFPVLLPFRTTLLMYVRRIWWAVLLGLLLGGMIDHFVPREYISHVLSRPRKRTIFYSVLLGFFMSTCSHGILALSIELHKKGASNPAVVTFLLASPWANMSITVMLFGFFGVRALFIVISALLIAVVTGLIFQVLEREGLVERNRNVVMVEDDFSLAEDLKKRMGAYRFSRTTLGADARGVWKGTLALGDMVLWWLLVGMGVASLAGAYVPAHVFSRYLGPSPAGMLVTLGLATVIEVCSEGSAPMAFEIFRQTQALGNAFVFLMAGVVTDYTEIGLLWHNVGRKVAVWLPLVTVPQVVLLGLLANRIF